MAFSRAISIEKYATMRFSDLAGIPMPSTPVGLNQASPTQKNSTVSSLLSGKSVSLASDAQTMVAMVSCPELTHGYSDERCACGGHLSTCNLFTHRPEREMPLFTNGEISVFQ
jgi:hypothetical protein